MLLQMVWLGLVQVVYRLGHSRNLCRWSSNTEDNDLLLSTNNFLVSSADFYWFPLLQSSREGNSNKIPTRLKSEWWLPSECSTTFYWQIRMMKPVLPFSLHNGGTGTSSSLKHKNKLQNMVRLVKDHDIGEFYEDSSHRTINDLQTLLL